MKNVGSPSAKRGRRHQGVFHRPSEPDQDVEGLLMLRDKPRKSSEVLVKWVMKNAISVAAPVWPEAHQRFSSRW
jgi:hypothetical protein